MADFNLSFAASELNAAITKANAAAPQSTTYTKAETNALIANKPGEITTGKQYTIDGQTVTAGTGAEAFNDLANNKAAGKYSHAEGNSTIATGSSSHVEGNNTKASGSCSHAEGYGTKAPGSYSHAEGYGTTASGSCDHAEGNNTTASGGYSHAEGYSTRAPGSYSHAEGYGTTASGYYSHAEGNNTTASGNYSHAEGYGTKASSANQHVQGKFNVEDSNGTYAFIIGNGTADNARHNAFAIDWNGLVYINGAATGVNVATLAADLAGKQDDLTEAQLNAVNSGINSTKVGQYDSLVAGDPMVSGRIYGSGDLNSATTSGYYKYTGSPSNHPTTESSEFGMLVVFSYDSYISQICHVYNGTGSLYFRRSVDAGMTWTEWSEI